MVAERLGYQPDTALTLGRFVAGSSARAKARRLGIMHEAQDAAERNVAAAGLKPRVQMVRLLGRDMPVLPAADGTLRAEDGGKPASAKSVQPYIPRAFGDRLGEARAAMEALAASLPPEELNRVGFRLYERFRPDVPAGTQGWGTKGSCGWSGSLGRPCDAPPAQLAQVLLQRREPPESTQRGYSRSALAGTARFDRVDVWRGGCSGPIQASACRG